MEHPILRLVEAIPFDIQISTWSTSEIAWNSHFCTRTTEKSLVPSLPSHDGPHRYPQVLAFHRSHHPDRVHLPWRPFRFFPLSPSNSTERSHSWSAVLPVRALDDEPSSPSVQTRSTAAIKIWIELGRLVLWRNWLVSLVFLSSWVVGYINNNNGQQQGVPNKMDPDGQLILVCSCKLVHLICVVRAAWDHFVNVGGTSPRPPISGISRLASWG